MISSTIKCCINSTIKRSSRSNDPPIMHWGIQFYSNFSNGTWRNSDLFEIVDKSKIILKFSISMRVADLCTFLRNTQLKLIAKWSNIISLGRRPHSSMRDYDYTTFLRVPWYRVPWYTYKKLENLRARPHPPPSYVGVGGGFVYRMTGTIQKKNRPKNRPKCKSDYSWLRWSPVDLHEKALEHSIYM